MSGHLFPGRDLNNRWALVFVQNSRLPSGSVAIASSIPQMLKNIFKYPFSDPVSFGSVGLYRGTFPAVFD